MEAAGPGAHKRARTRFADALVSDTDLEGPDSGERLNRSDEADSLKHATEMSAEEKQVREQEIRRVKTANYLKAYLGDNLKDAEN